MTEHERIDAKCESLRVGLHELKEACNPDMTAKALRRLNDDLRWIAVLIKREMTIAELAASWGEENVRKGIADG